MPGGHGRRCFQFATWLTRRLIVRSERGGAEKKAAPRGQDNPEHEEQWPARTYGHDALKRYVGTDGRIKGCKDIDEAASRPDGKRWLHCCARELEAFVRLNVIARGYLLSEIRDLKIYSPPLKWKNGLTVKYRSDGVLDKYKSRRYLMGDKHNAKYGPPPYGHYTETYSPSPSPTTTKIMQALV